MLTHVAHVLQAMHPHQKLICEQSEKGSLVCTLERILREEVPSELGAANNLLRRLLIARISVDKGMQVGPVLVPPERVSPRP